MLCSKNTLNWNLIYTLNLYSVCVTSLKDDKFCVYMGHHRNALQCQKGRVTFQPIGARHYTSHSSYWTGAVSSFKTLELSHPAMHKHQSLRQIRYPQLFSYFQVMMTIKNFANPRLILFHKYTWWRPKKSVQHRRWWKHFSYSVTLYHIPVNFTLV